MKIENIEEPVEISLATISARAFGMLTTEEDLDFFRQVLVQAADVRLIVGCVQFEGVWNEEERVCVDFKLSPKFLRQAMNAGVGF